ncbi:MAG: radical SAM/SPASM domain-containing protein [Candidatus Thorarchaeota archaeon]
MFSPTMGEVTLNKSFFEEVKYAKMKGFKVNVFTNGISLNSHENYKKIVNSGIDEIVISTGDINPKYEAEILGISQDLATQKIRGLINLIEYKIKTKSNIKITIAFRAKRSFKQIWGSMKKMKFKKFFEKKALYIDFKTRYDNWCGIITQNDLIGIMKLKKRPLIRKYPCASLWRISILSNGDIRLCACRIKETEHDDLVIGNIRDESLVNIINNEKGQKILSEWQVGNIVDVCKECSRYMFPKFIRKKKIPIEYQNLFHR